tara:strand:+ start:39875 stop:40306 length:432 start_codon:yes stop_codon:yes gene_type:complete
MTGTTFEHTTDAELAHEHSLCTDTITRAIFWGDDVADAQARRREIEAEQFRRRLAKVRGQAIQIRPIVFDDPGVRKRSPSSSSDRIRGPVITGAAKSRSLRRPSAAFLAVAIGALICCLAVSVALAGQRLVEIDARYAAQERT